MMIEIFTLLVVVVLLAAIIIGAVEIDRLENRIKVLEHDIDRIKNRIS